MATGLGQGSSGAGGTRLDGLVGLLDTGSNASVRRMAAGQIGEVVAAHPTEIRPVLRRVRRLLLVPSWDTRVAAGHALSAIASQAPAFAPSLSSTSTPKNSDAQPAFSAKHEENRLDEGQSFGAASNGPAPEAAVKLEPMSIEEDDHHRPAVAKSEDEPHDELREEGLEEGAWISSLTLAQLDLPRILSSGALLFGSSGEEYKGAKVDISKQRAQLKADLGLDERVIGSSDTIGIADSDLADQTPSTSTADANNAQDGELVPVGELVEDIVSKNLSARERNRLKREAKKRARMSGGSSSADKPLAKRPRAGSDPSAVSFSTDDGQQAVEDRFGSEYFDFQPTCEVLKGALLDPKWESRHGAAVGVRHILATHSGSVGRRSANVAVADRENRRWLEDISCRLMCVLVMDRFADFVGDAVVAPVRETAAMAIAAASKSMSSEAVFATIESLVQLLHSEEAASFWEVRHAVLLGIRYLLAVQGDVKGADRVIMYAFDPVTTALRDVDDDVRAVAAEALLPVAEHLVRLVPERIPFLVAVLWNALLDLDDISASTNSVVKLLTKFVTLRPPTDAPSLWISADAFVELGDSDEEDEKADRDADRGTGSKEMGDGTHLVRLVPRLYPFLRHSSTAVRMAVVTLLDTLLTTTMQASTAVAWVQPLCGEVLERLFRNILLEHDDRVLVCSKRVWSSVLTVSSTSSSTIVHLIDSTAVSLPVWLQAASHETRADALNFYQSRAKPSSSSSHKRRSAAAARRAAKAKASRQNATRASSMAADPDARAPPVEGPYDGLAMQLSAADALGGLAALWPRRDKRLVEELLVAFRSCFATARRLAADVCRSWANHATDPMQFDDQLRLCLQNEVDGSGNCPFGEVGIVAGGLFSDSLRLLEAIGSLLQGHVDVAAIAATCDQGKQALVGRDYATAALAARAVHPHISNIVTGDLRSLWEAHATGGSNLRAQKDLVASLQQRILTSLGYVASRLDEASVSLAASASAALVAAHGQELPKKVAPLIKALTASSRSSANPHVQEVAATGLATLSWRLSERGTPKPLALLVKNLTKHLAAEPAKPTNNNDTDFAHASNGDAPDARKGRRAKNVDLPPDVSGSVTQAMQTKLEPVEISRRGSSMTFVAFCSRFGSDIFSRLPWIWSTLEDGLTGDQTSAQTGERGSTTDALIVLRTIVAALPKELHEQIATLMPHIIRSCTSAVEGIQGAARRCLADTVHAIPGAGMRDVVHKLLPLLGTPSARDADESVSTRRGAALAVRAVVDRMGLDLIPYAAFLIVPIMMRMVDPDTVVREASSGVFGVLVRQIPLEGGAPDDPDMSASMSTERSQARVFLGQLLGTHPRQHYEMPVPIGDGVALRKYQQECLDWLAFLNRYGLHGALCDDMGLGKTLMTLCMLAGDRASKLQPSQNPDSAVISCPSLVVCPGTLGAHWIQEAERFFPAALSPVCMYLGSPRVRSRIRAEKDIAACALVVTSYEVLANDLEYFERLNLSYLVLDEGHVIKNPKTRVARAVRSLNPQHRLVLTGTPIQNSVLELWALFDFLMPGFLGSEKTFKETYAKPILASRSTECTEADKERGIVATEALHRQVLPFVMRRLKDDVLSELPPKIMQDYFCSLTPLQVQLYEDFSRSAGPQGSTGPAGAGSNADGASSKESGSHIFKLLSYLRRLCSHPKLVLNETHPQYEAISKQLHDKGTSLSDVSTSPKLVGLRNILTECGIGDPAKAGRESGGHRALIFAQLKQMLDIVESDLFKTHMPQVTYLRLDGSVDVSKRQGIVTRFNADPTIDCLLLTTNVGGLGLNLVGADTVIFLEHDWNPTKDLQAMDRAHRMGQKRTVNVYRLISRGTLEEKIMGIQKFKTHIANTVVNRENSSLQSMNTETLLSLFKVEGDGDGDEETTRKPKPGTTGLKAALADLSELWEESQYEDEYNMEEFLAGMQGSGPSKSATGS